MKSGPPVYDYDGYMADLTKRVPDLDTVVEQYIGESLRTYQGNSYLASMAMLGCASERAMRVLFDAYLGAIDREAKVDKEAKNRNKLRSRLEGHEISRAYTVRSGSPSIQLALKYMTVPSSTTLMSMLTAYFSSSGCFAIRYFTRAGTLRLRARSSTLTFNSSVSTSKRSSVSSRSTRTTVWQP